jgi:hypothetical protein
MIHRLIMGLLVAASLMLPGAVHLHAQWPAGDDRTGLEGCTIGVASGSVTADGRPLVWKTRDTDEPDNEVRWQTARPFSYLGVFNADGISPWMAVNERGFALVNANSLDLAGTDNSGNGSFMRRAMAGCATVADFQRLLDTTNLTGRRTKAHFAVIDTTGAAAIFETGGSQYWKYDVGDSGCPGYVIRTNFAVHGGGTIGYQRYLRSRAIIGGLRSAGDLSARGIIRAQMRDFSDAAGAPIPVPNAAFIYPGLAPGSIETSSSICGATSVSAAVIQGVGRDEPAALTTMWTMLGFPAATITVPYWPVGGTPPAADGPTGAPLCSETRRLYSGLYSFTINPLTGRPGEFLDSYSLRTETGGGLWASMLPAEDQIRTIAEGSLDGWRTLAGPVPKEEMRMVEERLAGLALQVLEGLTARHGDGTAKEEESPRLEQNYPNPVNGTTVIRFSLAMPHRVRLAIFDVLGREVASLVDARLAAGHHEAGFNAAGLASGMYWYRLDADGTVTTRMLVILK